MKGVFTLVLALLVLCGLGMFVYSTRDLAPSQSPATTDSLSASTTAYSVEVDTLPSGSAQAEEVATYMKAQRARFVAEAQAAYDNYVIDEPEYPWRQYAQVLQVSRYETDSYVSFVVDEYNYTGGANGIQLIHTFVYAPDGSMVALDEIVPEGEREALVDEVRAELYEINGIEPGRDHVFGSAIAELRFDDLQTFYLTPEALVIGFQEYEVAPGAAGAVRVELPMSFVAL